MRHEGRRYVFHGATSRPNFIQLAADGIVARCVLCLSPMTTPMTTLTRMLLLCAAALILSTSTVAAAAPYAKARRPAAKANRRPNNLAIQLAAELRRTELVLREGLGQPHVTPKVRRRVMKTFNRGARRLRKSVGQAQKDGVITGREARRIHRLTTTVRRELRMELKPLYRRKLRRKGKPRGKFVDGRRDGSGRFNPSAN